MNLSNASTSTSVHIIQTKKNPAYTVYYKYHFSGKMFITLPRSISPFESFKAYDDNNTLNCPPPPLPYKKSWI